MSTQEQQIIDAWYRLPKSRWGRRVEKAECDEAAAFFKDLVAPWYWNVLQTIPLCGSHFTIPVVVEGYTWDCSPEFISPKTMVEAAVDEIPGMHILRLGYIPIAYCSGGSGNPFVCRLSKDVDSTIVQVDHSIPSGLDELPHLGFWVVAKSLVDLFQRGKLLV